MLKRQEEPVTAHGIVPRVGLLDVHHVWSQVRGGEEEMVYVVVIPFVGEMRKRERRRGISVFTWEKG